MAGELAVVKYSTNPICGVSSVGMKPALVKRLARGEMVDGGGRCCIILGLVESLEIE
jgi:hypothetical protein